MAEAPRPAPGPDFESLFQDAACGLLVTSTDGTIRLVNRTFCHWLGLQAEALVDRVKVQELLTMGGRIFHQTHWAPLLHLQGSVSEVKFEMTHRDGRRVPMVMNALRRVRDGEACHELAVFIAEDRHRYERELMAARQRAEQLLAQEQQALQALDVASAERDRQQALAQERALFAEQMVAIVSHDLRNPLSVIKMSAHLLAAGELSVNQQRALSRLSASTGRAARLIDDLLDFSQARIGAGLQVERRPIDLHGLVDEGLEDLRLAFPFRDLVHVRVGSGDCTGSDDRLTQLMGNLVANAVAYGAAGRPITVTSAIDAGGFSLAVHNEGEPIAPELLPDIFAPMTRGVAAGGQAHSVGLGLFIVREIARAHGGDVVVASTAATGTTFTARFPAASSAALPDAYTEP